MANTVTVEDARTRLDDLIDRAHHGEEWLITDPDGQPVARLSAPPKPSEEALPDRSHASLIGFMKGQIELLPGWDEPLEDFKPYME